MRIVYLGTPQMAVPPLRALHADGHEIVLVVTRPDARRGRGSVTSPSPVSAAASDLGLTVAHEIEEVLAVEADIGVVVAYGRIIKPHILAALPMVNLHFSLLPRWRGAAPVERALLAGDTETGVCLMAVEEGLDTGGVYARTVMPIGPRATADELRAELVEAGTSLLLDGLARGLDDPEDQVGEVTYADKVGSDERELDWIRPAAELDRVVRVGGAYTWFRDDRFKIHAADLDDMVGGEPGEISDGAIAAGAGGLRPITVQPGGKPSMSWRDFANGARIEPAERFGRSTVGDDE